MIEHGTIMLAAGEEGSRMPIDDQRSPSVWTRPPRHQKPALTREHIVTAAVGLLDAEGIDALTMRRLGKRLGAVATSVYWHVSTKDELLELVVDEVFGEVEVPSMSSPLDWRVVTVRSARSLRAAILRHPWIGSLLGRVGLAYLGPNLVRVSEELLAVFEGAGLSPEEAERAMKAITTHVTGAAISEAAYLSVLARSGRNEREWLEGLWPATELAVSMHERLKKRYFALLDADPRQVREDNFTYGLDRLLDGVEVRLNG